VSSFDKRDIAELFQSKEDVAFEQFKVTAFIKARFYQTFHRDARCFGNTINRFGGAFFKLRLSAAYIIHGRVRNTAIFRQPIFCYSSARIISVDHDNDQ
jgi:hypothetical protein